MLFKKMDSRLQDMDVNWKVSRRSAKVFSGIVSALLVLSVLRFGLKIPLSLAVPYGIIPICIFYRLLLFVISASQEEEGQDVILKRQKKPHSVFLGILAGAVTFLLLWFVGHTPLAVPFAVIVGFLVYEYRRRWYEDKIYKVKNLQIIVRNPSFPIPLICPVEYHGTKLDVWSIGYNKDNHPQDFHGVAIQKNFGFVQVEDAAVKVKIIQWISGADEEAFKYHVIHIGHSDKSSGHSIPFDAEELGMVEFK